ncbi:hypothetical protein BCL50_1571 [Mycolicibacterium litorale]|nr:hypothetical protein BCL50_1571 [Mycolicibacterium litorale]
MIAYVAVVYPGPVNIGVRASYWRFIKAPGGADKVQT